MVSTEYSMLDATTSDDTSTHRGTARTSSHGRTTAGHGVDFDTTKTGNCTDAVDVDLGFGQCTTYTSRNAGFCVADGACEPCCESCFLECSNVPTTVPVVAVSTAQPPSTRALSDAPKPTSQGSTGTGSLLRNKSQETTLAVERSTSHQSASSLRASLAPPPVPGSSPSSSSSLPVLSSLPTSAVTTTLAEASASGDSDDSGMTLLSVSVGSIVAVVVVIAVVVGLVVWRTRRLKASRKVLPKNSSGDIYSVPKSKTGPQSRISARESDPTVVEAVQQTGEASRTAEETPFEADGDGKKSANWIASSSASNSQEPLEPAAYDTEIDSTEAGVNEDNQPGRPVSAAEEPAPKSRNKITRQRVAVIEQELHNL